MNTNKHQRQVIWQIYIPLILILGLLVFSSVLIFGISTFEEKDLHVWSDISMLVITIPLLFSFVLIFIFLFILIYVFSRIKPAVGNALLKISAISNKIFGWAKKFSNYISRPVIQIESLFSQFGSNEKE